MEQDSPPPTKWTSVLVTMWHVEVLSLTNLKTLHHACFWSFTEASLCMHDWLKHRPLVIKISLQPIIPPHRSRGKTQSSSPLVTGLAPLATSPKFLGGLKFSNKKSIFIALNTFGSYKGFKSFLAKMGTKAKYIFLPANPKGSQPWIFIGRTDVEAEVPILWPPDEKRWLVGKEPVAGKDWRPKEETTEDEMVEWHHWFNGHEFEQTLGDCEG